jgi:5-oxoprolinase (ATP-hydrolysing)
MTTMPDHRTRWRFWVDRGGTFTDVVARDSEGRLHTVKLLSQDPGRYDDAAVEAMRRLTCVSAQGHEGPLPPAELRLGTTVATNALLERAGEPVLLAITRGFEDALAIGTQDRPDIFARQIVRPAPLYASVIAIDERVTAEGEVLVPLDLAKARTAMQSAFDGGLRAVAIVLMHGWRHTAHEAALARIAHDIGFSQVSVSHKVSPTIRLIARGDTSVADAYLSPVLRRYVEGLEARLGPTVDALYMQSGGALVPSAGFNGKDAVLSGPAGGIVGMAATAKQAGFGAVIGFDMGGTSTDVSWYSGGFERDSEARIAGVRIRAPMLRIHTVAAGGGSLCRVEAGRFLVGPESAGAVPGPACYRRGGPLALTDCNLALGKLVPAHFPHVFGPDGDQPLDRVAVDQRFEAVTAATGLTPEQAAEGFVKIAVAQMAHAILAISVRRGHDVSRAALACFGGAGGQHACLVADELGIDTVLVHPLASLLSAYGMGLARRGVVREATLALPLDSANEAAIGGGVEALAAEAEAELRALVPDCDPNDDNGPEREIVVQIRPAASENAIEVPFGPVAAMAAHFAEGWQRRFGFAAEGALVAEAVRVEVSAPADASDEHVANLPAATAPPLEWVRFWSDGAWHSAPLHAREGLAEGATLPGPALVVDAVSTVVIEPGWTARVDAHGNLILTRAAPRLAAASDDTTCDPVRLEIMSALFMAVAEEMGAALQHSAASVNIRERLDFSCAVFDAGGNLIANAPHMPVHLGSMGESVRCVLRNREASARGIRSGDAYALNAPFAGGTHLPDITVVMPVFDRPGDNAPAWFVAARGHHADVGGIAPGSMPPDSRTLADEGVVLDDVLLVDEGKFREPELVALLSGGAHPARNVPQNMADLRAQLAACARGAQDLRRVAAEQGRAVVDAYMGHVQDNAEAAVRALIGGLSDGQFAYEMDNGAVVRVAVRVDRAAGSAVIDFAGTSDRLPDNFNAGVPIVRAAVLYVVRTLLDGDVPMNEGCLRPLTILVPRGSMLDPGPDAAVVAGNVETSQVITDALFGALGAMAAAQGTMNNFTFGDARHQYYETIAGGSGAGPGFDGTAVVQTHMTNSRLTDPEVLEARFPVLLEEFSIRRGSGGEGVHRGGDGAVRRVRFRQAMTAGILSNRRKVPPFGLAGGAPGAAGRNAVERADGSVEHLSATASVEMQPGDVFVIETPGGGGFGARGPAPAD